MEWQITEGDLTSKQLL